MRIDKAIGVSSIVLLLCAFSTRADEIPRYSLGSRIIHGGSPVQNKAHGDTINLMAAASDPTNNTNPGPCSQPEPIYRGDFEMGDEGGRVETDGSGWSSRDLTAVSGAHWQVSDYDGSGTPYSSLRAYCGDASLAACTAWDVEGGYGNSWNDLIEFRVAVDNNTVSSEVEVTAQLQHDTEPGYDFTYLSYRFEDQPFGDIASWDGESQNDGVGGPVAVSGSVTYMPMDYLGGNDIAVYWRFRSDEGYSDEDCFSPSAGACMVDDVNVRVTNDGAFQDYFTDFNDGTLGFWNVFLPQGVGDFARIYRGLEDNDPCSTNYTAQVAFIDDNVAVPGTGGGHCINWCYGPGGYIVTTTGGLAGEAEHIRNAIESPVMDWPQAKDCTSPVPDGIILEFDVYKHEDLTADAPGIFYTWGVRSADTDGSAGPVQSIYEQPWQSRNYVYYGGPEYIRHGDEVTDLMNPGRDFVQVQLAVWEAGYYWFWTGDDGYPAPYFDNVTVKVFPTYGPSLLASEMNLAQDNFPERGTIDFEDLESHSVRFDMANNISPYAHLRNDPGDSIVVKVSTYRAGSDLVGEPTLHYLLQPNPVFTPAMRTAGMPARGSVLGMPAVKDGQVYPEMWAFDLPDTGFLFPGDVLRYYIAATDAVGGGELQSSTLPADTTGFSTTEVDDALGYDSSFTVRALPSIREYGGGDFRQPELLFINDFTDPESELNWHHSLWLNCFELGRDYDSYYVNEADSGVGNGVGGRANSQLLSDYRAIFYTCGNLGVHTLSNGDFQYDAGDDIGTLAAWLELGDKDIFLTGDDLASDLGQSGPEAQAFLQDKMGVSMVTGNIRFFIGNQVAPRVQWIPGNPIFSPGSYLQSWIAFGGCPAYNTFDGVNTTGGGQRLGEFVDPSGIGYTFSAATLNVLDTGSGDSRVISLPVGFTYVQTDPNGNNLPLPARAHLLREVSEYFGIYDWWCYNSVEQEELPALVFTATNFPNPFNPSTTIMYSLPAAGHLKLSIYNVRGQLVKTLIDGPRPAGANQSMVWDGTNNQGSAAASGMYFYEARAAGEARIGKMTLLK